MHWSAKTTIAITVEVTIKDRRKDDEVSLFYHPNLLEIQHK